MTATCLINNIQYNLEENLYSFEEIYQEANEAWLEHQSWPLFRRIKWSKWFNPLPDGTFAAFPDGTGWLKGILLPGMDIFIHDNNMEFLVG